jgi:glycine cleavage system H protein
VNLKDVNALDYELRDDLKYTSSHEWVKLEDTLAIIGITDYAQHQLGDIVFVELPDTGLVLEKGSNAAEIESVKAVGDLIMPLSGEIVEVNQSLSDSPEIINTSPYEEGWIIKIKITHNDELNDLLSYNDYTILVESEEK